MSRVQLTKSEAIVKIDEILENQLNLCIAATYNELIEILNENARAGVKKIKGCILVGFNPFAKYEDIIFDIEKEEIIDLWLSTLCGRRAELQTIKKYTSKFDLCCWDYDDFHTFAFRFFTGSIFGGMTKTGKIFAQQLNQMLADCGMVLSFDYDELTSQCKIKYSCKIQSDYVFKEKIIIDTKKNKAPSIEEVREGLKLFFSRFNYEKLYNETENGANCLIDVYFKELQRTVSLGAWIDANESIMSVIITLGRVSYEQINSTMALIDEYKKRKNEEDFSVILTDPTEDGFDGQLMFMKTDMFDDMQDLNDKLTAFMDSAVKLCQSSRLVPFLNVSRELES